MLVTSVGALLAFGMVVLYSASMARYGGHYMTVQIAAAGIGLAIVKKIVENHDGIITANGEPDKGATFEIYIPIF
jgi:signal transduction histidine kinase